MSFWPQMRGRPVRFCVLRLLRVPLGLRKSHKILILEVKRSQIWKKIQLTISGYLPSPPLYLCYIARYIFEEIFPPFSDIFLKVYFSKTFLFFFLDIFQLSWRVYFLINTKTMHRKIKCVGMNLIKKSSQKRD